jgi:hypothetical protein
MSNLVRMGIHKVEEHENDLTAVVCNKILHLGIYTLRDKGCR